MSASGLPPQLRSLNSRGASDEHFRQGHHRSFDLDHETKQDSVGGVEVLGSLPENKRNKNDPLQRSDRRISRPDRLRVSTVSCAFSSSFVMLSSFLLYHCFVRYGRRRRRFVFPRQLQIVWFYHLVHAHSHTYTHAWVSRSLSPAAFQALRNPGLSPHPRYRVGTRR